MSPNPDRITLAVMKQNDLDEAGALDVRARRKARGACEECAYKDGKHAPDCFSYDTGEREIDVINDAIGWARSDAGEARKRLDSIADGYAKALKVCEEDRARAAIQNTPEDSERLALAIRDARRIIELAPIGTFLGYDEEGLARFKVDYTRDLTEIQKNAILTVIVTGERIT